MRGVSGSGDNAHVLPEVTWVLLGSVEASTAADHQQGTKAAVVAAAFGGHIFVVS